MSPQKILLMVAMTQNIIANVYDTTSFIDHKGLYYQFNGNVRTSQTSWDLITYLDLNQYNRYAMLIIYYNLTTDVCSNLPREMESTDVPQSCKQFAQATLPYLFEIETNHRNILLSISQEVKEKHQIT